MGCQKVWQFPLKKADDIEDIVNDGLLFDGSSVAGLASINDSDLLAKPDINSFSTIPWRPESKGTSRFICDIFTTEGKPYDGDPRGVLKKALEKAEKRGYQFNIGPEPEFFIIKEDENGNYIPADEAEYFDVEPLDQGTDIRRENCIWFRGIRF